MPAPTIVSDFLDCVRKSSVADPRLLDEYLARTGDDPPATPARMADALVAEGLLTRFQADQLLRGRWRNFILCGKYVILEPLGSGGMGTVYLCSHKIMRRPVAIKVLPAGQADDPGAVERFHREAQAVAQLRHPNIVGAHDVDRDGKFHFLVMEYVDGVSLQELVKRVGPLDPIRAAHYVHQAALGLEHAHEAGLVHRDIKPANLLVDRAGVVKILDLGLARFFRDTRESVTQKYDGNAVLGTADYLAPEQAVDSHNVDIRCDIYSLGITFYFLLAGRSPFQEGTVAEKLIWHQVRQPKPVRELRPSVPEGLAAVLDKMIAKDPSERYQTPAEVAGALAPWTQTAIDPPSADEIPLPSAGARIAGVTEVGYAAPRTPSPNTPTPASAKPPSTGGRHSLLKGPPAAEVNTRKDGRTTTIPPSPLTMKSIPEGPAFVKAAVEPAEADDVRRRQPFPWLIVALAAAGVIGLAGLGLVAALLFLLPATSSVANGPPPIQGASPQAVGAAPSDAGVAVTKDDEGLHFRTAAYDALVDKDGCLNSLRVGGVEFLRPGEPLADGKSVAKGAYFYSEKDGNFGAVNLRDVSQPAPNVVVARGDKFAVRYEFAPDAVTLRPTNSTDDGVPFYMVLDSATVTDVTDGQGRRYPVPVARTQADPVDPAWQTSTWSAGRARLTITDGTRIWGPWGKSNAQVWERALPTYGSAVIRLEPRVGAAEEAPRFPPPGGLILTRDYTTRRVRTDLYEATVEGDGCLSSLRVAGVEFLRPGLNVSRGAYFHQKDTLAMLNIVQPGPNVLTADGPGSSARYEFTPDGMTWTLQNKTGDGMAFYVVFDAGVLAARTDKGDWLKAPGASAPVADGPAGRLTWYAGRSRVTLKGGDRVWGPWFDHYQVWEAALKPGEKRTVTVELGRASPEEVDAAAAAAGAKPASASEAVLYGPLDYQVFQRKTRTQGEVRLRGHVRPDFDRVEARLTGKPLEGPAPDQWQAVGVAAGTHWFDAKLPAPAGGWYRLEVRALKDGKEVGTAAVDHVGVGEVFVGAGQSNSTNCGQEKTRQHSGMVSSFSGTYWQPADDPQPGTHDDSVGGSFWPAFGDAMAERYHVPIGVASTGHSGTSVNAWQPGGDLFPWTAARMNQLGRDGFRAVLWHQGESDVNMPPAEYDQKMTALIEGTRREAGWDVPWFVAQATYHTPTEPSYPEIRAAQKKLWEKGVALEGPDTDTLTGANRDNNGTGIHFSPMGLSAHGRMWADKVGAWLDKALAK